MATRPARQQSLNLRLSDACVPSSSPAGVVVASLRPPGPELGSPAAPARERLADGAALLRGFARTREDDLITGVEEVATAAPFRHMTTPGGFRMSVAMTSSGPWGWVTDRARYRYAAIDPSTGRPWPAMPPSFRALACDAAFAAGFDDFAPDACLLNRYEPGARLSLHQDQDERDLSQPIVSVSLGISAVFLFGGFKRSDRPLRKLRLEHGDVVVWGGPARLRFHGILPLADDLHPRLGRVRINLTFRRAM